MHIFTHQYLFVYFICFLKIFLLTNNITKVIKKTTNINFNFYKIILLTLDGPISIIIHYNIYSNITIFNEFKYNQIYLIVC